MVQTIRNTKNQTHTWFVDDYNRIGLPMYLLDSICIKDPRCKANDTIIAYRTNVKPTRTVMAQNCVRHHKVRVLEFALPYAFVIKLLPIECKLRCWIALAYVFRVNLSPAAYPSRCPISLLFLITVKLLPIIYRVLDIIKGGFILSNVWLIILKRVLKIDHSRSLIQLPELMISIDITQCRIQLSPNHFLVAL